MSVIGIVPQANWRLPKLAKGKVVQKSALITQQNGL